MSSWMAVGKAASSHRLRIGAGGTDVPAYRKGRRQTHGRLAAGILASLLFASPTFAQTAVRPPPAAQETPASRAAASDTPTLPSFGSLFRDLGNDFRRIPSRQSAQILGVGALVSLAVMPHDDDITRSIAGSQSLDAAFNAGNAIGGGIVQVGAAFTTFAIGHMAKSPRIAAAGADLVRAQAVNAVVTHAIKISVRRMRPNGANFSFPSGHASATVTTAAVLQRHFGWKVGGPAYALAAYVAACRLQDNRHYLSDVIFGAAVGIVAGRTATIGRGSAAVAVSPFVTQGGGGIGFVWVGTP